MGIIRSKIILKYKMLNLDDIASNKKENKDNDWPFRMLIIGPSGSCKANTLLHLINNFILLIKYIYTLKAEKNKSTNF